MLDLTLDTETTGLFDYKMDLEDPRQPRIVQIAIVLGNEAEVVDTYCTLIKPDGWELTQELTDIHGITTEQCHDEGIPILDAIAEVEARAERAKLCIAHNLSFDMAMYNRETVPLGMARTKLRDLPRFCTMKRDERFKGRGYPTGLGKLYLQLFGKSFEGHHNALEDALATREVYYELMRSSAATNDGLRDLRF